eukprot:TRINITY_DN1140_c0_g1_i1.p1 TRINITY_DN1140_c0_g1~~TRINITY_DN1140_c0_g1_i1.p1  ORF type:complete len:384 (-),score=46.29 TRINITY_DN1140_c0_g1_i1:69-1220(-)
MWSKGHVIWGWKGVGRGVLQRRFIMNQVANQKMPFIDLRSDTVSWPTQEMRIAMANAKVGDDVYGDDPSVIELENYAAQMFGKEAGLFISSGTQGNLISVMVHCSLGDEVIMGDISHTFLYEAGGVSALAGCLPRCLPVQSDGSLKIEDIEKAIREEDDHFPRTKLVIIENTQNRRGGLPLPPSYMDEVGRVARKHNLKYHIDGARIFNAAAAFDVPVKDLVRSADSVTFCLSKGLGAPIGSVLLGNKDFILAARRKRKMLGGGMRQAGIIAAGGLVALKTMPQLLYLDHQRAKKISTELRTIPSLKVLSDHTNFVWFEIVDPKIDPVSFSQKLWDKYSIKMNPYSGALYRCSIHFWVGDEEVNRIVKAVKDLLGHPGLLGKL